MDNCGESSKLLPKLDAGKMMTLPLMAFGDVNGCHVAAYLIDKHCYGDPELRARLRW